MPHIQNLKKYMMPLNLELVLMLLLNSNTDSTNSGSEVYLKLMLLLPLNLLVLPASGMMTLNPPVKLITAKALNFTCAMHPEKKFVLMLALLLSNHLKPKTSV